MGVLINLYDGEHWKPETWKDYRPPHRARRSE
jgi:hypothetical protein